MNTLRLPCHAVFDNRPEQPALVTIFIPTFHRASVLRFAVESALLQQNDSRPIEILVVDNEPDPSQDPTRTASLMETYRNRPGFAYFRNDRNYGPTGNWNQGYTLARTEWVIMLHDDDRLAPNYLQILYNLIASFPRSALFTFQGETIHSLTGEKYFSPGENRAIRLRRSDFLLHNPCFIVGIAMRRTIWMECGGFNDDYLPSIDYRMWSQIIRRAEIIKFLPLLPLTHYYIADNDSARIQTSIALLDSDTRLREELLAGSLFPTRWLWRHYFRRYTNHWIDGVINEMHRDKPIEAIALLHARKTRPTLTDKIVYAALGRYFNFVLKHRIANAPTIQ